MSLLKSIATALIGTMLSATTLQAQQPWTLQQCIEHALNHNIEAKQQQLNVASRQRSYTAAKLGILPSVNAGASHNFTFGRAIDYMDNKVSTDLQSTNLSVGASLYLFRGLQQLRNTQQSHIDLMAAQADADRISNNITLNIATAYMQILYSTELVETQRRAVELSQMQLQRTQQLVNAGSLPEGNRYEMEAQLSTDELALVNAENQLALALLTLTQMLDLEQTEGFSIMRPNIDSLTADLNIPTANEVYDYAQTSMPQVRSAELRVQSTEKSIAIARGSRYPTLSLDASVGTGARSYLNSDLDGGTTYANQFKDNMSTGVGLSLRIPIFNGLQTETNIAHAKIAHSNAQLNLQNERQQLYKAIQQAYADAIAAQKKLKANEQQLTALRETLGYTERKYNLGLLNAIDYTTARSKTTEAEHSLIQAKYDLLFKTKILQFYQGLPLQM